MISAPVSQEESVVGLLIWETIAHMSFYVIPLKKEYLMVHGQMLGQPMTGDDVRDEIIANILKEIEDTKGMPIPSLELPSDVKYFLHCGNLLEV